MKVRIWWQFLVQSVHLHRAISLMVSHHLFPSAQLSSSFPSRIPLATIPVGGNE
jgi:hypothetical protein